MRRVQSTGGLPGRASIAGVDDDNALPVMLMASLDEDDLRAVLLVVQVVHDAHLGVTAFLRGEVDREARALVADWHARVAALAPNVRVLALRRWDSLVREVVDVGRVRRAAEGPRRVGGDAVLGLGEEEDAVVCEMWWEGQRGRRRSLTVRRRRLGHGLPS